MPKITFLGAGSTIFAKSVLGDCMLRDDIEDLDISLHDIDAGRLSDSETMLKHIAKNIGADVTITKSIDRAQSLKGAKYIVNAVQIGGYEPCTVTDFEIPKKYGLRQTIADTIGVGGIFRALRTIPVLDGFAKDIEHECPDALLLNYTNPMAILTGYLQKYTNVRTLGLCHSVQVCVKELLTDVDMLDKLDGCRWEIAGINHMAWLLKCEDKDGSDLYPEIKRRAKDFLDGKRDFEHAKKDKTRLELMLRFGYYIAESSEHLSEYTPWFIKSKYPELIERYNIPLDEYPRRCIEQMEEWKELRQKVVENDKLEHEFTKEYAAGIIAACETGQPYCVHGNVPNTGGLIANLPREACVEVPCMIDKNGVNPVYVGKLPEQCAALNRTNIGVQLLTLQAARSLKKEDVYMAAMLDPHTASELSIDDIVSLCDDLFEAHKDWMPPYR